MNLSSVYMRFEIISQRANTYKSHTKYTCVPLISLHEDTTGLAAHGSAAIVVLHPAPPGHLEPEGGELELDIPMDLGDVDVTVPDLGGGFRTGGYPVKEKLP